MSKIAPSRHHAERHHIAERQTNTFSAVTGCTVGMTTSALGA
jgi:hypothetical protein